jgi:H+-translocating NAD(P) transhydrogenase subunit alpha
MKLGIGKEDNSLEKRIAITLDIAKKLIDLGIEIGLERGISKHLFIDDSEFEKIGCKIFPNKENLYSWSEMIWQVNSPEQKNFEYISPNTIVISFFDPNFEQDKTKLINTQKIDYLSMNLMPRTTLYQNMDAISSQANLSGYVSVIMAANHMNKIMPMMTTPSGMIGPATVFVLGAGVAGLQAIATAKRLGAKILAYDTREVVEEQVKSLGAKFIKIDVGQSDTQTKGGYAKALTDTQLEKQKLEMTKILKTCDIVITTAQVFGRKAPVLITKDMIASMKKGSCIVDLAVGTGGNVEGSENNKITEINGVKIIGFESLPSNVSLDASKMYSSNLFNLLMNFYNKETKVIDIDNLKKSDIFTNCQISSNQDLSNQEKGS